MSRTQASIAARARGVSRSSAADTVARLRTHLADDLDTPRALAAIDAWVRDTLDYGGTDTAAGAEIATAVDALLGVRLR